MRKISCGKYCGLIELRCGRCCTRVGRLRDSEWIVSWRPTVIEWRNNCLTPTAAPILTKVLKSEMLVQVETLQMDTNTLGDEVLLRIAAAAAAGGLPQLSYLSLTSNQIGGARHAGLASRLRLKPRDWRGSDSPTTRLAIRALLPWRRHSRRVRCRSSTTCSPTTVRSATRV